MKASKYFLFLLIILIGSCADSENDIPEKREKVNKQPVATYIIPMGDPKLDRNLVLKFLKHLLLSSTC